jgi:hypothetical protein
MGILTQLQTKGSNLTAYDGATPPVNVGATKSSKLHADGNLASYSLNGSNASDVIAAYNAYLDGVPNPLPQPSTLDLNGSTPSRYLDNLPK